MIENKYLLVDDANYLFRRPLFTLTAHNAHRANDLTRHDSLQTLRCSFRWVQRSNLWGVAWLSNMHQLDQVSQSNAPLSARRFNNLAEHINSAFLVGSLWNTAFLKAGTMPVYFEFRCHILSNMKEYIKALDGSSVRLPCIPTALYRFDMHVSLAPEKLETSVIVLFIGSLK